MSGALPTVESLQARLANAGGQVGQQALRIKTIDSDRQELTVIAPMRAEFERGAGTGQWHGGAVASVIDSVAVFTLVAIIGAGAPTVNLRVDYLKPAFGDLQVTGRLRRVGRSIGVADVDVHDAGGALVAIGRATLATQSG